MLMFERKVKKYCSYLIWADNKIRWKIDLNSKFRHHHS